MVLAAAFSGLVAAGGVTAYWLLRESREPPPPPVEVVRGTSSVVTSMRELQVLQTTSFHLERVIDLKERQNHLFGMLKSEDAILLVAAADVTAGVDLSGMTEDDIQVDEARRSVRIVLPPPVVLSARLDNDRTYVHTRKTDALAIRQDTLETRARLEAERSLRNAALAAGILDHAHTSAERTLRALMRSLGFDQVDIVFREE